MSWWHSALLVCIEVFHPSITYTCSSFRGSRGEARGWVRQWITGMTQRDRHPFLLTFTPMGNLGWPVNLTCMSLVCGKKPEHPVETHAGMGRTCKLHTERPQLHDRFQPWTLLLWGDSVNHRTAVLEFCLHCKPINHQSKFHPVFRICLVTKWCPVNLHIFLSLVSFFSVSCNVPRLESG